MTPLGRWLREQRQARAWNVPEMTRRLRQAAREAGDKLPANESVYTMIRRWEHGDTGVSERYRLYYCKAFAIAPGQFGPAPGTNGGPAAPDDLAAGRAGDDTSGQARIQWLAATLRDLRDSFRDDAKTCQARADQTAADPVRAALCRGQALAYTAAAEHLGAAVQGTARVLRTIEDRSQ